ncbi:efflux RND transporter periplasmic adaptor subunit [Rhodoligotrophos ferricapiens]|uniref:efflux RND transporter periplasmic adaptor subunit n=1 Tax=Rhodoligotrophos ferricapiens TaxID=3069264 RepID=UPI00315C5A90
MIFRTILKAVWHGEVAVALRSFSARIVCVLLVAGLAPTKGNTQASSSPPPSVQVAPVKAETVTQSAQFVGRVEAIQQVDIQPRVEGFVDEVQFTEGSMVKKGQPLFTIDPSTYEAALETATAAVQQARAQLEAAKANATKATLQYNRVAQLRKTGTVSQAHLDNATAEKDTAIADVGEAQAAIAQAKAQQLSAQLNLNFTKITSPISGQIGKANRTAGNLVSPASGTLATVVQTNPIRVAFAVSDVDYLKVIQMMAKGVVSTSEFVPHIKLPDGSTYAHPGTISFANNTVDQNTGTIVVRADFKNPDRYLVPGQFVNVTVEVGDKQKLPVVPGEAVMQDVNGAYVFVLSKDNRAEERRITTAQRTSSGWVVSKGLRVGEIIIVGGLQRVKAGIVVNPIDSQASGS